MKINPKSVYHSKHLDVDYYRRQMKNPYESTKNFFNFLNKKIKLKNKKIVDLACGNGANLIYLKKKYKTGICYGLDQNKTLLKIANDFTKKKKIKDLSFLMSDIENYKKKVPKKIDSDGAICIQTLSVMNDYKNVILFAKKLKTNFICVNSLFWKGKIDFKITVNFLNKNKRLIEKINHYNIYSIDHYLAFLKKNGYKKHFLLKFKTNKIIKTKNKKLMGSHTVKLDNKREIKSGPLILDWYFILSKKR